MKPAPFRYARPENLADAVGLLAAGGPDVKILAGGQSLVPMLNLRLARPAVLVDDLVVRFGELEVSDVMIHRTNMITVNADEPAEDVVNAVIASPVTRLPLWRAAQALIVWSVIAGAWGCWYWNTYVRSGT